METFYSNFMLIAAIGVLGAVSPGPDFVVVMRNSLMYSRRAGIYTSIGVSLGVLVHIAYITFGLGVVIVQSAFLYNAIKYCGAAYLIYLGFSGLFSKGHTEPVEALAGGGRVVPLQGLKSGFVTNVLNPKATVFFLSVFSQVVDPATPLFVQLVYGLELSLIGAVWFCFLAYFISTPKFKSTILRYQGKVEKAMSVLLILFGVKVGCFQFC